MLHLRRYVLENGIVPVSDWLAEIRDVKTRVVIRDRLDRLKTGLIGAIKSCRDGVFELKIDYGPGYRVYFARIDKTVLLLLCGGDKKSQKDDIETAVQYLLDFKRRTKR